MDRYLKIIGRYIPIKFAVCLLAFVYLLIAFAVGEVTITGLLATFLLIAISCTTGALARQRIKKRKISPELMQVSLSSDMVLVALGIYYLGGLENVWLFIMVIPIFVSGYLFSFKTSIICSSFSYGTIVIMYGLESFRLIPTLGTYTLDPNLAWGHQPHWVAYLFSLFLMYYFSAVTSGLIGAKMRKSRRSLTEAKDRLEEAMNEINIDMETAMIVQQSILPENLNVAPELKFVSKYLPCQNVGGDLYDVIRIDENKTGVLIADIIGHGVSAALVMTMAKVLFSRYMTIFATPEPILRLAGNEIISSVKERKYMTAFLGIWDKSTSEFTFSRAGHPYPYIIHTSQNKVDVLESIGISIGFDTEVSSEEKSITLLKGDKVVLYTDGLVEETNSYNETYTRDRFQRLLELNITENAESLLEIIIGDLKHFLGDKSQSDDVTVVIMEVL